MSHQGFSRRLRLLNAGDYSYVFEQADLKVHGKGMMALARFTSLEHPRAGLIVSKKNVKRAVDRNRFKRLVRESIRLRQDHMPSMDIVILAKRGVQDIDNETLFRQLHGMWKRLQRDAQAASASNAHSPAARDT